MPDCYFTIEADAAGEWIRPTELCRGPWDPEACHAGPPTGMLARASEALVPDQRLARLTVELVRPIPHAGFRIVGEVVRGGRTVSTTALSITDLEGGSVVTARGLHMAPQPETSLPTAPSDTPHIADAEVGRFPVVEAGHDLTGFRHSAEMRYPDGDDHEPGPTTAWMRTVPLLATEDVSGFSRICPLADCGNAISRNGDSDQFLFVNTDLTVAIHREPVGEWFGMRAISRWEPDGIGMSDALLFDDRGPVGRAIQTLLIRPLNP
jgi:Acyl-CoA thioesterase C-terminal domain/Acyl-CoA thioesterase N-terminal domain